MENKEKILFHGLTDSGRLRKANEDTFICQQIWDEHTFLFCVIDGMGGYEGGERASEITRESILNYLAVIRNGEREQLLKEVLVTANNKIIEAKINEPQLQHMGCVVSCCIVDVLTWQWAYAHVGDTRIYEFRRGILRKISHDHSLVGYREEAGEITEEEAMTHPQRNVIARELGRKPRSTDAEDFIESGSFDLSPDTQLLLCSDGLTDMINSRTVAEILNTDVAVEEKVRQLIEAANIAGGRDNITVLLAYFLPSTPVRMITQKGIIPENRITASTLASKGNAEHSLMSDETRHALAENSGERTLSTDSDTFLIQDGKGQEETARFFRKEKWFCVFISIVSLLLLADVAFHFLIKSPRSEAVNIYMPPQSGTVQQKLAAAISKDTLIHFYNGDTLIIEHPLLMDIDSVAWIQQKPLVIKPGSRFGPGLPALIIIAKGIYLKNIRFTGFSTDIWSVEAVFKTDSNDTAAHVPLPSVKTWRISQ